jgi:hypothetical protein
MPSPPKLPYFFSVFISVLSLIIAGLALWNTSLAAPDIKASTGSVTFRGKLPAQVRPEDANTPTVQVTLKLTCNFSNLGARSGGLADIVLEFKGDKNNFRSLFIPMFVVDDEKYFAAKLLQQPDIYWTKGSFSPIELPGKQSVVETVLFVPDEAATSGVFSSDTYRLIVFTREAGKDRWTNQQTLEFAINQATIDSLKQGTDILISGKNTDEPRKVLIRSPGF